MPFLLDTNICIALIKSKHARAIQRLVACVPGDVAISSISAAELRFGATKSNAAAKAHQALDEFLISFEIDDFDEECATAYGAIRWELERKGTPIRPLDTLIASQALAHDLLLVTNNEREFRRIKHLQVENWLR